MVLADDTALADWLELPDPSLMTNRAARMRRDSAWRPASLA